MSTDEDEGLRAHRTCGELISWIHALRSSDVADRVSLAEVLEGALSQAATDAFAIRQHTCSAVVEGNARRLVGFFARIVGDVVADTTGTGPSARTILVRVDVEKPGMVAVEIADLRRVVGAPPTTPPGAVIEIVRASDALLGITLSIDRDPDAGTVVRVEMPVQPLEADRRRPADPMAVR